jgi:hypothetical protein
MDLSQYSTQFTFTPYDTKDYPFMKNQTSCWIAALIR